MISILEMISNRKEARQVSVAPLRQSVLSITLIVWTWKGTSAYVLRAKTSLNAVLRSLIAVSFLFDPQSNEVSNHPYPYKTTNLPRNFSRTYARRYSDLNHLLRSSKELLRKQSEWGNATGKLRVSLMGACLIAICEISASIRGILYLDVFPRYFSVRWIHWDFTRRTPWKCNLEIRETISFKVFLILDEKSIET